MAKEKIVTIGKLLDAGLIKKTTKVKIVASDLKSLHLIKPIPKKKLVTIIQLNERGMMKK